MRKASKRVSAQRSQPAVANPDAGNAVIPPSRNRQSLIQWPTEKEIREVSERLARIKQMGIRSEAEGDYFRSGNQAYQMQEIIRATAELSRKSFPAKA